MGTNTETPPTYNITTFVNGHVIGEFMKSIPDPFVSSTTTVGFRDVLRSLLRHGHVRVQISVGGDKETVDRVLELDPEYLATPRRRVEQKARMQAALSSFAAGLPEGDDDGH